MNILYAFLATCAVGSGQPCFLGAMQEAESCVSTARLLNSQHSVAPGGYPYRFACVRPRDYPWDVVR